MLVNNYLHHQQMAQIQDKRLVKGIESRKTIINAALTCIATHGLCHTTLDRIAEIAGVSRPLVVFHFKSKTGMMSAVLSDISTQYSNDWSKIISQQGLTKKEKLLELITYDIRLPIENPELITVWHTFWGEAKGLYKELGNARDAQYFSDIESLIVAIAEEGDYQNINPRLVSYALVSMLFGLWWKAHLNLEPDHYQHSIDVVQNYLSLVFPQHF